MGKSVIATAAIAYMEQAILELRALDRGLGEATHLAPGVVRVDTSLDRAEFFTRLAQRAPIFVRHVMPVDLQVELTDSRSIAERLGPVLSLVRPGERIAIQIRRVGGVERSTLSEAIGACIHAAGGHSVVQGADRILSLVLTDRLGYVGLSSPAENLSPWPGGEIRFSRQDEQFSQPTCILMEAFATFQPDVPESGTVLDLWAARGGWTAMMLERGLRVTVVDVGELDAPLRRHPYITLVQRDPADVEFPPGSFDLLTCGRAGDALHTAGVVVRLAEALKQGALAILTIAVTADDPKRAIRMSQQALQSVYDVVRVKQLFHNRDDVTMFLRKR